jgi:hypothetical protein
LLELYLKSIGLSALEEINLSAIELSLLSGNRILLHILDSGEFNCNMNYHSKEECEMLYKNLKTREKYENSGLYKPCDQDIFQFSVDTFNSIGFKCCGPCQGKPGFVEANLW